MILALILFFLTYALMLALPKYRPWIALSSAALFVLLGILPASKILSGVDWNVIMMIGGTMGVVSLFIDSGMPTRMSDQILNRSGSIRVAVVLLAAFAGYISAFVDNVATVLMVAPVALAAAKKQNISPVPAIIAISVASNLQGAATLVGDTTSILLGGYAEMDFLDFFVFHGRMGMFWIVEIGAVVATLLLFWLFRKEKQQVTPCKCFQVDDYFPTVLMCAVVVLLICASFIPNRPAITNGLICVSLFAVGLLRELLLRKNYKRFGRAVREIDVETLLLLIGLFVVIAGITEAGVIQAIAELFVKVGGGNLFWMYTLIVWASVLFSAFIDNIPYVATMLPVVSGIAVLMGVEPFVLYFGLLTGATLGGNLTPIGASANITAIGILRREGFEVKNRDFFRIGIPFTLTAVICGYVLVWLAWGM